MGANQQTTPIRQKRQSIQLIIGWTIISIPILLVFLYMFSTTYSIKKAPKVKAGTMNLHNWNFKADGNIKLDGNWDVYWDQLLAPDQLNDNTSKAEEFSVPGIWNDHIVNGKKRGGKGVATFHTHILLPENRELYALKLITMSSSYKLWVNGKFVAQNGRIGSSEATTVPEYHSQIVTLNQQTNELDIVLQIANFHHWKGGFWHPIKLGQVESIQTEREGRILLEFFMFGCLIMMAVYHFGLYSLRRSDKYTLFFALVCFCIGSRSLFTGENTIAEIFPHINWLFARKLEFLFTFLSVPFYATFSYSLYPSAWHRFIYNIIVWSGALMAISVLFLPSYYFTFESYLFAPYSFVSSIYILYVFIRAARQKLEGSLMFLVTTSFFFITIINEMLNQTEVIHTGLYLPVGLWIVIFAQAYILSSRMSNAFRTTEIYSSTFRKFVPLQFLNKIAKHGIESIKPGNAEMEEVAVLFSDIRSFTKISEKISPEEVFGMLNKYLAYVEPPIRKNNGYVDKYMGDGIMALFESSPDRSSSCHAVVAAISMKKALVDYNTQRQLRGETPLEMGIGIHSGKVIIGTLGGEERMDSTAIGDAVNLCSRIEGMTKLYGSELLVSSVSLDTMPEKHLFLYRYIDSVVAKGKSEAVGIWEVVDFSSEVTETTHRLYELYTDGIQAMQEQRIREALTCFEQCLQIAPEDKPSTNYHARCTAILNGDNSSGLGHSTVLNEK